jgi:circadian clock protein KaiC
MEDLLTQVGPARIQTGIAGLDEILGGGLPTNHTYLLEGVPGTGKTTMALQFLLEGARNGEPVLYITLSETKDELSAVARSHGWALDGIHVFDLAVTEGATAAETQYTIFHPSEVELGEITKTIIDQVERIQPCRIVLDSLSELRLLARDQLRYRRQILAFKQFFVGRECAVLLLDDHTSATSDRHLESIAHGVFMLEHNSPGYGAPQRKLRVLKLRGVKYRGGYHDFSIDTGGVKIFPRLVAREHYQSFSSQPLLSGVDGLDKLTGGGLDAGTSTLIMGPAGAGKSTLALSYAVAAIGQGMRAAYYTFDESLMTLRARAAALGIELKDHIEADRITLRQVDPAELSAGEFTYMVQQAVEKEGKSLVVIDSLNGYYQSMPEAKFLNAYLHELLAYLAQQGVTTMITLAQYGLLGTGMASPVDVTYLADTVLLLRYFEASGEIRQAISMVKKRSGGHERAIRECSVSSKGISVGRPLREFRGILGGQPEYIGGTESLNRGGGNSDQP